VTLQAGDNVVFTAAGDVSTSGGAVAVTGNFGAGDATGAITMDAGTTINAGSGAITMTAPNDIKLTGLSTTHSNLPTIVAVTVTSDSGAIVDAGDTTTDIIANNVALTAANGIGSLGLLGTLETAVSRIAARNTTSGAVDILNSVGGTLTIGTVGSVVGIDNSGSNVTVVNSSPLTVADDISAGGNIVLTASDSSNPGDDIVVNATATASADTVDIKATGTVTLNAGDRITVPASATLSAIGLAAFVGDFNNQDAVASTTISIAGQIFVTAGGSPAIQVKAGAGADSVELTGTFASTRQSASTGPAMVVEGGDGLSLIHI
jgi:hypothetical protein